jgi:hypothetical protein
MELGRLTTRNIWKTKQQGATTSQSFAYCSRSRVEVDFHLIDFSFADSRGPHHDTTIALFTQQKIWGAPAFKVVESFTIFNGPKMRFCQYARESIPSRLAYSVRVKVR